MANYKWYLVDEDGRDEKPWFGPAPGNMALKAYWPRLYRRLLPSSDVDLQAEQPEIERAFTYSQDPAHLELVNLWINDRSEEELRILRFRAGLNESDCPLENMLDFPWEEWPDQIRIRFSAVLWNEVC